MKKIISYIGFAIKSKSAVIGQGQIKHFKSKINLILVDCDAAQNLINLAKNVAAKHNCPLIITKVPLQQLSNLDNIKIIGITDENLSKAIILNKESINIG